MGECGNPTRRRGSHGAEQEPGGGCGTGPPHCAPPCRPSGRWGVGAPRAGGRESEQRSGGRQARTRPGARGESVSCSAVSWAPRSGVSSPSWEAWKQRPLAAAPQKGIRAPASESRGSWFRLRLQFRHAAPRGACGWRCRLAASKGPSPWAPPGLPFAEAPAAAPDTGASQAGGAKGPGGGSHLLGGTRRALSREAAGPGRAPGTGAGGLAGGASQPERRGQGDFPRARLPPAPGPGGFSSQARGQVGWGADTPRAQGWGAAGEPWTQALPWEGAGFIPGPPWVPSLGFPASKCRHRACGDVQAATEMQPPALA